MYCKITQLPFGLPHLDGKKAVIDQFQTETKKVITAAIDGRKLALITYHGWDKVSSVTPS